MGHVCAGSGRSSSPSTSADLADLAVDALCAYRLTRLITTDEITADARNWAFSRLPSDSKLAYLLTCDHCVSVYMGATLSAARWVEARATSPSGAVFSGTVRVLRYALAISGAVSAYREVSDA